MTDDALMLLALDEARKADGLGEVPIGCAVWHAPSARVVAVAHNRRALDADPTAHAEVLALRAAGRALGDWRLEGCTLAVTLEPCAMCAGALVNARVPRVAWGADDPKAGAGRSLFALMSDARLNHRCELVAGVRAEECAEVLRAFFRRQRALGKK